MLKNSEKIIYKGLEKYINPYRQQAIIKPIRTQMLELLGEIQPKKGLYHNNAYEELTQKSKLLRKSFLETKNLSEKKNISENFLHNYESYIENRYLELPDDFLLTKKMEDNLKGIFDLFRDRKMGLIKDKFMLEFLNEYTKVYKFEIPIDPELLIKQIHPYHGHLTKLDKYIEFEKILKILKILCVSSFEKLQGQTLLSDEICSYGYWNCFDNDKSGFLEFGEFKKLMRVFDLFFENWDEFLGDFELFMSFYKEEFLWEGDVFKEDNIVSFDQFRYIYLERNL